MASKLEEFIEQEAHKHFGSLREDIAIFPWDTNDYYNTDVVYNRNKFLSELADFIDDNFAKFREFIEEEND